MNTLVQRKQQANDELRLAIENMERAQNRMGVATKGVETMTANVHHGTKELTDALLQEPTHWNAMYQKLVVYKEQYGNVDVKRNLLALEKEHAKEAAIAIADGVDEASALGEKAMKEIDPDLIKLGSWIVKVRLIARKQTKLSDVIEPYKIIALNRLGFNWDPRENYWMERFDEVKAFLAKSKSEEEPKHMMPNRKTPLGVWCDGQVLEYNKFKAGMKPCYISKDRIDLLSSIGFVWDRQMGAWMTHYNKLKRLHENFGYCDVSGNHNDKALLRWIRKQKKKYENFKEGTKPALTEEQVKFLDAVHFFDPPGSKRISSRRGTRKHLSSRGRGRPKNTTLIPAEAQVAMAAEDTGRSAKSLAEDGSLQQNGNLNAAPNADSIADAASLSHLGENDAFNVDLESVMMNTAFNGENPNERSQEDDQVIVQESAGENCNEFNEPDSKILDTEDDELAVSVTPL